MQYKHDNDVDKPKYKYTGIKPREILNRIEKRTFGILSSNQTASKFRVKRNRYFYAHPSIYSPAVIAEITHRNEVFEAAANVGGGKWFLSRSRPPRRDETRRDERNETDNDFKRTGSQPRRAAMAANARKCKMFH